MADDIAAFEKKNKRPGPTVHNPNIDCTRKRHASCLNFKGDRVGFLEVAIHKGENSANFHTKTHDLTEKRTQAPMYKPPGKHDLAGPAFLRKSTATKLISPVTYETNEAYTKTQTKRPKFYTSKGKNNSMVD